MPKRDMWAECYAGEHQRNISPEDFKRVFCQRCRNPECSNSAVGQSRWVNRMETQVDLLLDNPLFADPDDPRFKALRELDFASAVREAVALEVSSRKGDWTIPTDEEIDRVAQEMMSQGPVGFEAPPGDEPDPEPEPSVLWQGTARGSKGAVYEVALTELGDGAPVWTCTCPNFHYRKAPPEGCKHIVEARELYLQAEAAKAEEVVEKADPEFSTEQREPERRPPNVDAEAWAQMRERGVVPRGRNTRFPSDGLMVDGSAPPEEPEPDPWAAPADPKPKGKVVDVGAKVKMGGGK